MPANLFRTRRAPIPMDTSVQFRHTLPLQIRFNDVDTLGHVNNTVYFSFYDLGKSSYFQDVHPAEAVMRQTSVVLAHAEVDFLVPIRPEEHIAVQTAVSAVGHKSFTLVQQVINSDTRQVKCFCTSVVVAFDAAAQTAVPVPESWVQAFCRYEGRDLRRAEY